MGDSSIRAATFPATNAATAGDRQLMGLVRWGVRLLALCFGWLVVARAAGPLSDPDTWWHLRLGDEFQGNWTLGSPGNLTVFADRDWIATQWLPEVVAARVEHIFGPDGVAWLAGIAATAIAVSIYASCRSRAGRTTAMVVTVLALLASTGSLTPRPQLVSFLLLSVVTSAWLRTAEDLRPRWWLILLTYLWACSHGMWFLAPVVGLAVITGLALERRLSRRDGKRLGLLVAGSLAAASLTPAGPSVLWIFFVTRGKEGFVTEMATPSIRDASPAIAVAMLAAVLIIWVRKRAHVPWPHILVLVMAAGWTLMAQRTVALGAIMTAPLLAAAIQSLSGRTGSPVTRAETRAGLALVAAAAVVLAVVVPRGDSIDTAKYPEGLNAELSALPDGTVVYNDFVIGGWLAWRHRHVSGVIDGMTHAYSPGWVGEYVSARGLQRGWYEHVEDTEAEYALLPVDAPLALELEGHHEWAKIAEDNRSGYVLLEAPS